MPCQHIINHHLSFLIGYVGSSKTITFLFVVNYGLLIDLIDNKISFPQLLKVTLHIN